MARSFLLVLWNDSSPRFIKGDRHLVIMKECDPRHHKWKGMERKVDHDFSYSFSVCTACGEAKYGGIEAQSIFDYANSHQSTFFTFNDWLPLFLYWEGGSIMARSFRDLASKFISKFGEIGIQMEKTPLFSIYDNELFEKRLEMEIRGMEDLGLVRLRNLATMPWCKTIMPGKISRKRAKETIKRLGSAWISARYDPS